jgi:phosphohistidine phosphatase
MQLLVIRHAIAEDKEVFARSGRDDDLRPLTENGRDKMRRAARGLREVAPPVSVLATSPLVRARETAEIVMPALSIERAETVEALRPDGDYDELLTWLREQSTDDEGDAIAIVGHEPQLSGFVTWLMSATSSSRVELKKGGACLLDLSDEPRAGKAVLRWALTPSQLRRLGE